MATERRVPLIWGSIEIQIVFLHYSVLSHRQNPYPERSLFHMIRYRPNFSKIVRGYFSGVNHAITSVSAKWYLRLSHVRCWLSLLIGYQPWSVYTYFTCDVISVRYKEKRTLLMTSQIDCDGRLLFLPMRCDRVTPCFYNDLDQMKGIAGTFRIWKRFTIWQI